MYSNDEFALEEYKFAKEKIRKNEEKRFNLIALNITAYAAILGFSDKIDPIILPIALVGVLIICSTMYTSQSLIQMHTSAFIIEKYEVVISSIGYEKGINEYRDDDTKKRLMGNFKILKYFGVVRDPFMLLTILGLGSSFFLSWNMTKELIDSSVLTGTLYLSLLIFLYIIILRNLAQRKKTSLNIYREYWQNYLNEHNKANSRAKINPRPWNWEKSHEIG